MSVGTCYHVVITYCLLCYICSGCPLESKTKKLFPFGFKAIIFLSCCILKEDILLLF